MKSATNLPAVAVVAFLLAAQTSAQDLEPGDTFSDTLSGGGQGPEMVVIPAGSYRMGCVSGLDCTEYGSAKPVHVVTIPQPFAVSKYEVTFEDYDRFTHPIKTDDLGWGRGRRPVIHVSWHDAKKYVAWLSSQTGQRYRLLSEAEWEYSARAGSATKYHFGNKESELCRYANLFDTPIRNRFYTVFFLATTVVDYDPPCSDGASKTSLVGRYEPNAFGLHDMHGNVSEWVEDCWNWNYSNAPPDGSAWLRGRCDVRVFRGGSWNTGPWALRSAFRVQSATGVRHKSLGLRVARTLDP